VSAISVRGLRKAYGGVGGREVAQARAERERDLGAVRLVADGDDRRAASCCGGDHALGRGARPEPVVDAQLRPGGRGDGGGGLSRPQQRAGEHELRRGRGEPLGECGRLLPAALAQRAQLVRVAGIRVGVPDEEEAHGG